MATQILEEMPENVLITGSLIRYTVVNGRHRRSSDELGATELATAAALMTVDLFKNIPAVDV